MARLSRGEGAAAFEPSAVRSVDLGTPLADLVAGRSSTGAPYRGAAVLATLHGEPLGFVKLGLRDGRLSADELANGLWAALGARLGEHVRRHGCLPPAEARPEVLAKGILSCPRRPPARRDSSITRPIPCVPAAGDADTQLERGRRAYSVDTETRGILPRVLRPSSTSGLARPYPAYSGIFPCLRFGVSTRFVCSVSSARISLGRVS
jgi:hypothetical protein